jgi:hypothetical protein
LVYCRVYDWLQTGSDNWIYWTPTERNWKQL